MKTAKNALIVLVTAPSLSAARKLARLALERRLVACVNLVPGVESHYHWQGKIETSKETLMLLKTTTAGVRALEKLILANHPYDTPEFVVLPVNAAAEKYLVWWSQETSK